MVEYDKQLNKRFNSKESRTRYYRILAHNKFDKIRKYMNYRGKYTLCEARGIAYIHLAEYMGKPKNLTHIALFNITECKKVMFFSDEWFKINGRTNREKRGVIKGMQQYHYGRKTKKVLDYNENNV